MITLQLSGFIVELLFCKLTILFPFKKKDKEDLFSLSLTLFFKIILLLVFVEPRLLLLLNIGNFELCMKLLLNVFI